MPRTARRSRSRRPALLVLLLVLAAGAALWFLREPGEETAGAQGGLPAGASASTPATPTGGTTDDDAATPTAEPAAEPVTATSSAPTASTSTSASAPAGGVQQVRVTRTYAGWDSAEAAVVVGAVVDGVIEADGTCTLTLTMADRVAAATAEGTPDASTTACGGLSVPGDELASGAWDAVVSYASPASAGESQHFEVVVP